MHTETTLTTTTRGVLATLRGLAPDRVIGFTEAMRVAERQATKLLELHEITSEPVPSEVITSLPRVRVRRDWRLPVRGSTAWDTARREWVISLNARDSWVRRRFTMAHEFKHIIDHGARQRLTDLQREQVAEYFAGCLLIPKRLLRHLWCTETQDIDRLARLLNVSRLAVQVRINQIGLVMPTERCDCQSPNLTTEWSAA